MDSYQDINFSQESSQNGFFSNKSTNFTVPKCHMHNKHQNGCKFCLKYKEFLNKNKKNDEFLPGNNTSIDFFNDNDTGINNINSILRNNILSSEYYKIISEYDTFEEILQEIYQHADHAEPFCTTTRLKPSTIFCCLYKFLTMKLADDNLKLLLDDTTSVYAKCCGFLYIRYSFHYEKLYKWYKPYLLDIQEFTIDLNKSKTVTLGGYLHSLIMDEKYFTTVLPRLPIKFKNYYGPEILEFEEFRLRKLKNLRQIEQFTKDSEIEIFDGCKWIKGEIIEIHPKGGLTTISVSLTNGSTEIVDLSAIRLSKNGYDDNRSSSRYKRSGSRSRSRSSSSSRYKPRDSDRYKRSRSKSKEYGNHRSRDYDYSRYSDRYEEYRHRERQRALANGKDYSKRPSSFKSSLSQKANIRH